MKIRFLELNLEKKLHFMLIFEWNTEKSCVFDWKNDDIEKYVV